MSIDADNEAMRCCALVAGWLADWRTTSGVEHRAAMIALLGKALILVCRDAPDEAFSVAISAVRQASKGARR
jgi:hypothetical protein